MITYFPDSWYEPPCHSDEDEMRSWMTEEEEKDYDEWLHNQLFHKEFDLNEHKGVIS